MLQLLRTTATPFSRAQVDPGHFTASVFVWSEARDRLLLLHHPKLGRWLQPGGHVEPDDADVEATALREMEEEVGLLRVHLAGGTLELLDLDIHLIPARRDEPAHLHHDVRFLARIRDPRWEPSGEDVPTGWFDPADLAGVETDDSVRRAAGRARAKLASIPPDRTGTSG